MSTRFQDVRGAGRTKQDRSKTLLGAIPIVETSAPKPNKSWKKLISSMSMSTVVHAVILFALSWIYFDLPNRHLFDSMFTMIGSDGNLVGDSVDLQLGGIDAAADLQIDLGAAGGESIVMEENQKSQSPDELNPTPNGLASGVEGSPTENESIPQSKKPIAKPAKPGKSTRSSKTTGQKGVVIAAEGQNADHFVGRTGTGKAGLLKRMGGTDASEAAVAKGLVWLRNHQLSDGSWSFYHLENPRCDCTQPGSMDNNPNAATAMALLAFLGAGQTNEAGDYQPEVQKGLDFLLAHGIPAGKGICFSGGLMGSPTFYTHGLVTIALSEAFAMTGDVRLRPAITGAIDYLAATQDSGGGWRYFPGQTGDTSVVAWQLMALKSAQFSRITVPQKVFTGVERFMGSVSSMRGSRYSYLPDRREMSTPSMTAAGLLCRMYLDWNENNGGLRAGIRFLDEHGPEPEGMYYNYYATQVMHHWGGPEWERWNPVMREYLIKSQIQEGHATGSWDVADRHGHIGGRHYMTTLAVLTLEVYYRHLPLYQKDRIEVPLINQAAAVKEK